MDAFEQIVAKAFDARGYWTRTGFKVELDKATKKALGNPSMPRPEIDVIAYKPGDNEIILIECKSYLDSYGVRWKAFSDPDSKYASHFKLFHNAALFAAVRTQVVAQLRADGMLAKGNPRIRLCLVAGKVYGNDEKLLKERFEKRGWLFVGPSELVADLRRFADHGYENEVVTVVVKLLERNLTGEDEPA